MGRLIRATDRNIEEYYGLFVNRLAYTRQSSAINSDKGRCWYYRPKDRRTKRYIPLTHETIRGHLEGKLTIGLYSTNPRTQRCKWIAVDADYSGSVNDLLRLQQELKGDGVHAALEQSRRGGHLWIFGQTPLLACDCRLYIAHLADRLRLPMLGKPLENLQTAKEGIEIFPKQDQVTLSSFGNALRGPLGVHRACLNRFWFYGAHCRLEEQLLYLKELPKLTEEQLSRLITDLPRPQEQARPAEQSPRFVRSSADEFRILNYVGKKRRRGNNFYARCPSCASAGKDKGGDNLAISVSNPRFYKCWAGCTKHDIRKALGCPINTRIAS